MKLVLVLACSLTTAACTDSDPPPTFTARVRAPLAAPTIAESKAYHDQVARQGEAASRAAGDFAHQVGLGTTALGTTANEFLAIDQWRDAKAAAQFYANPDLQAALGPLFAAPPQIQLFERHSDWVSWGEMGAGRLSAQPHWFVTVQGRLAKPAVDDNQDNHDAVASAGEVMARAAGDIAHLPHLAVDDNRVFFNVDVWSNEQAMLATFTNPEFQAGLASLFEAPPDVRVYASTDWYQWYAP